METAWSINIFYPILFITISVVTIVLICSVKTIMIKFKDNDSENYRFKAHIEEHIDTTDKFKNISDDIIKTQFTVAHEKELHNLEIMVEELNQKFDLLLERIIRIENNK